MENPFKKTVEKNNNENEEVQKVSEENNSLTDEQSNNAEKTSENDTAENLCEVVNNELQEKYDNLNNQYIRLAADFDNFRKRQMQEKEDLLKYGAENTIKNLIDVLDNFDRGLKAIENMDDVEKVKECYKLAYKNLNEKMVKLGLEVIKTEGMDFDPNMHEAVMQTPSAEIEENKIIAELQKGYKLGDKVLRASLVNVATSAE